MKQEAKVILIIGLSKTGKTHFGGQLYGRLKNEKNSYKLRRTPDDLSQFEDILQCLNEGKQGKHTDSKYNQAIVLPVLSSTGEHLDLVYPDYGGEQLKIMMEQRQFNTAWKERAAQSNHWFLFLRLDLTENIVDVTTKFYKQIEEEKQIPDSKIENISELPYDSSAFYIELIQALLSLKQISIESDRKPRLTILLSCWDKLKRNKIKQPEFVLASKMPLLHIFIKNMWSEQNVNFIGLSSLGKDLNKDKVDQEYAIDGPENFGYVILPNGDKEIDLTLILDTAFL
jgi:hypothetical protein